MRAARVALCLLTCGAADPALAQTRPLTPLVQLGFVGDVAPSVGFGARWTYTPTPEPRRDPATGMFDPVSATWSFEALGAAGITFAGDDPVEATATASAGFLRPISSGTVSAVGLMALGSLNPTGIAPALRVETSFRAIGLQAGVLWFEEGSGPRAAVTVDVTTAFICDLVGGC